MRKRLVIVGVGAVLMGAGVYLAALDDVDKPCVEPPLPTDPAALYELSRLRDPTTLGFQVFSTDRVEAAETRVVVRRVAFDTIQWRNCGATKRRVEAYLAMPASIDDTRSGRSIGVVLANDFSDTRQMTIQLADEARAVVVAPLLDDLGATSGRGTTQYMTTTVIVRALTLLDTRPEVDGTKLGLVGRGDAATAVWKVAAFDERTKSAVLWFAPPTDTAVERVPVLSIATATVAFAPIAATAKHRWWWSPSPPPVDAVVSATGWWLSTHLRLEKAPPEPPQVTVVKNTWRIVVPGAMDVTVHAGSAIATKRRNADTWTVPAPAVRPAFVSATYQQGARQIVLTGPPIDRRTREIDATPMMPRCRA